MPPKRMELLPFKRSKLAATETTPAQVAGFVIYDADAGRTSGQHRIYVFETANFEGFVTADKNEVNLVVEITGVAHSKEQLLDGAPPPATITCSWNRAVIHSTR